MDEKRRRDRNKETIKSMKETERDEWKKAHSPWTSERRDGLKNSWKEQIAINEKETLQSNKGTFEKALKEFLGETELMKDNRTWKDPRIIRTRYINKALSFLCRPN